MAGSRKYSLFISSTYEDLKVERQALIGVALENGFIPVGMEQFHGAPADQWTVITKVIDECDFYLLIVGGRYGSIDESVDMSYTEKEYDYAKKKGLPVLVLIKNPSSITEDKMDYSYGKYDKYELMRRLNDFRNKIKANNTVAFFDELDGLKYEAGQSLKNAIQYADEKAGWVRFKDVKDVINEEVEGRNRATIEYNVQQQNMLREMKDMLDGLGNRISDLENHQPTLGEIPTATKDDIEKLFRVEGETLIIGNKQNSSPSVVGQNDVGNIPIESALLLVYAADGDGRIMKVQSLGTPVQVFTSGKQFMTDNSHRESARWVDALDRLISWDLVKPVGYKGQIFELTETGYNKAEWLKGTMKIDTSKEPLAELKQLNN